jgi:hypothetical protein
MLQAVMQNQFPSHLSDDELTAEVMRLAQCERETSARLVAHLAEFDARRLYLGAGYPSLFAYCTAHLHISEYGAYNRMEAARAARRFPVILQMLSDGALNLATVRILAPATVGNIELRCRSHNAYEAELFYGTQRTNDANGASGIVREASSRYLRVGSRNSPRGELGLG